MIRSLVLQKIITNVAMDIRANSPQLRGLEIESMADNAAFEFLRTLVRVNTARLNTSIPLYSFIYSAIDGKLHTAQRFNDQANQWEILYHYTPQY